MSRYVSPLAAIAMAYLATHIIRGEVSEFQAMFYLGCLWGIACVAIADAIIGERRKSERRS